jgi:Phosphopantetheine attachment site.
MTYTHFYDLLKLAVDTAEDINMKSVLADLEGYDSLSILGIMAMADGSFGVKLTASDFSKVTTVESLINIIGREHFNLG